LLLYESYILQAESHVPEALDAATRGLSLIEQAEGTHSWQYIEGLLDRALFLVGMGRYDDAVADYERYISLCTEMLGADNPQTLEGAAREAEALADLGRYREALDRLSAALPALERAHGPDYITVVFLRGLSADLMCRTGRCQEALALIDGALSSWASRGAEAVPSDGAPLYNYRGKIELALGDVRGAERDGRKGLALTGMDGNVADALDLLARAARARDAIEEAIGYQRRAVESVEKSSDDSPDLAVYLALLGELLAAHREPAEARRTIERAMALFDRHPGDSHLIEPARAVLATLLARQASHSRAP